MTEAIIIFIAVLVIAGALWFWRRKTPDPVQEAVSVTEPRVIGGTIPPDEKIAKNVRRFTLALEQCEKGEERKAELRRNLDYWAAVKAAADLRPENG